MNQLLIFCIGCCVFYAVWWAEELRAEREWMRQFRSRDYFSKWEQPKLFLAKYLEKFILGFLILRWGRKEKDVLIYFPDFLDLLGLGLSAGLTFQHAWKTAVLFLPAPELKRELNLVQEWVSSGRSWEDSLRCLASRWPDTGLQMTMLLLIQSLKQGAPLHIVAHDQADALRQRRLAFLERRAHTASLRLLLPLFLFIFPTLFLILFTPLFIQHSQGFSLFH